MQPTHGDNPTPHDQTVQWQSAQPTDERPGQPHEPTRPGTDRTLGLDGTTPTPGLPAGGVQGYQVLGELGRGGMGVVYRAIDTRLNRQVALKMILSGVHADANLLDRFRAEAQAVAHLQHPNIVQIYEIGEQAGLPFFALEFVDAGSLEDRLDGTPLPPDVAAGLVAVLARAVHFAHQRGVIHRDLKPANVLLAAIKDGRLVNKEHWSKATLPKITDFGLAKRMDDNSNRTETGTVVGTPAYMAPEQAQGRKDQIGPIVDVYALGVILYELLTGRPPFVGASPMDTLLQVVHDEPLPPIRLQGRLPRDLNTICMKCLQKAPAKRYASALDLADDLQRFLDGQPIRARPAGPLERAWKWARRKPAMAALMTVSLIAVGTLLTAGSMYHARIQAALTKEQKLVAQVEEQRDQIARDNERQHDQVVHLNVANGLQLTNNSRYLEALPWLVEALRLDKSERGEERQRLRLGGVLRLCPAPDLILFHAGRVTLAAFSPDGRHILTDCSDRSVRLWDATSGELVATSPSAGGEIWNAAFSRDSQRVVVARADNQAQVWNLARRADPLLILKHDGVVLDAVFSPDGQQILTGGRDNTARLWERDGKLKATLRHDGEVTQVGFSPDGKVFLTASLDRKVRLWDAANAKPLFDPLVHEAPVTWAIFAPGGDLVAAGCKGGAVQLWNARTGMKKDLPAMGHSGDIEWLSFSEKGDLLATGSKDNTARVWNAATGLPVTSALKHGSTVYQVALSKDGKWLTTASDDNTAALWDVTTGAQVGSPLIHNGTVTGATFSPDCKRLLTACADGTARLWRRPRNGSEERSFGHQGAMTQVAYQASTGRVLTTSEDDTARQWDVNTGKELSPPLRHKDDVLAAHYSPDGRRIATASADGTARIWNADTGQPIGPALEHKGKVYSVEWSSDGLRVATASADQTARIWDAATGKQQGPALTHGGEVNGAWFAPGDGRLLTASADDKARIWDVAAGQVLHDLDHKEAVLHAAWSSDGSRVLTTSDDSTARVWDASTGKPITPPLRHSSKIYYGEWDPACRLVVTASDDNTARVWDAATGKAVTPPLVHRGTVRRARFSPDGQFLATASDDNTACLWSVVTSLQVSPPLAHPINANDVVFAIDGRHLLTACADGKARLWNLRPDDRPVDDLIQIAQLLSGSVINAEYGLIRLETERLRQLWQEVRRRHKGDFTRPDR